MEPSLFLDLVEKYFPRLVLATVETINGAENNSKPYYFRRFLGQRFSLSGKWEALSVSGTRIMADVIAMDSSIPLKKRPALSSASGEIPKIAMEMALNESDLTNLQLMASSTQIPESQIIRSLFLDTTSVIVGQYERLEHMFLEGLSTGAVVVAKGNNVGTEIRLDFQYRPDHQFLSSVAWSDPTSTPLQDLAYMVAKAELDGNPITRILLDRVTMNNILKSADAKAIYAEANGVSGTLFVPTDTQLNAATQGKWGYVFEVVVRTTQYQIDGVDVAVQPWAVGQVVGINNENLGDVVWSRLAEMSARVGGVVYQEADEFILASKYRVNRPSLAEFTSSQSRALPVVSSVQQIYHMDSTQNNGPIALTAGGADLQARVIGVTAPEAEEVNILGDDTDILGNDTDFMGGDLPTATVASKTKTVAETITDTKKK